MEGGVFAERKSCEHISLSNLIARPAGARGARAPHETVSRALWVLIPRDTFLVECTVRMHS